MSNLLSLLLRPRNRNDVRQVSPGGMAAGTDLYGHKIRPHVSLKARMLGGHSEKITRLRGLER